MGIRPKVHFFDTSNNLKKIPYSKFDRLLAGDQKVCYQQYASQRIKCAISYVEILNRQPIKIVHCDYIIIPFNEVGGLNIVEYQHGKALMYQSIDLLSDLNNIIDLQRLKAQKQFSNDFTWQANQQQIKAIVDQIFF
ncbi:hypothetical protein [Pseudoalteromonas denitrificans]|uniref:Uncharacterized protein n=1 Tax=Pseudoalteromonas denitrificans DSM 6059 TaxID=1123010 RepID=A0A1I1NJP9_9GAMM|nr:hypothetical protein [Pseudoalteromonas denitrificans]SFC94953.1 hypothetical protein SAMN02745724_03021 [Pseudoalteromonas denitrificans DSM 6059]